MYNTTTKTKRTNRIDRALRIEALARRNRLAEKAETVFETDSVEELLSHELSKVRIAIYCDICGSKLFGQARIIRGQLMNDGYCPECRAYRDGVLQEDVRPQTYAELLREVTA